MPMVNWVAIVRLRVDKYREEGETMIFRVSFWVENSPNVSFSFCSEVVVATRGEGGGVADMVHS